MYKQSIEKIKPELNKVIEFFQNEMKKIRSGKASPTLVEDVVIDCFGSKMALKQLAAISCPEPRQIIVQPWSKEYLEPIEKALSREDLGSSPIVDGQLIRINLPSLTSEFREKLLTQIGRITEEAHQTMRKWRDEAWKEIQEKTRTGEISEDDKFKGKDE
ncbi:ribosome-recycling factor, partial [Patescibacteria group bacterium]|nr:ribosome-recycling factor [Patescibacteria group bacterium]